MATVIEIFESVIFWFIIAILFSVIGAALINTYRRNCSDLKKRKKKYSVAVISDTIAGFTGIDGVVLTGNTRNNVPLTALPSSLTDTSAEKMGSAKSLISIYFPSRNASVTSIDVPTENQANQGSVSQRN